MPGEHPTVFPLQRLQRRATPNTFERGEALSQQLDIPWHVKRHPDGTVVAEAWFPAPNRSPFHTRVSWDGVSLRTHCTCPVRRGRYCRHRVALGLRLRRRLEADARSPTERAMRRRTTPGKRGNADEAPDIRFTLRARRRTDWFDFSITVHVGDEEIPIQKLLNAWRKGQRFVRTPGGRYVSVPLNWFDLHGADLLTLLHPTRGAERRTLAPARAVLATELAGAVAQVDADEAFMQFPRRLRLLHDPPAVPLPDDLRATLRPYQRRGYAWLQALRETGCHGVLADDMGLGKTVQVLALLLSEKQAGRPGPSLIVAPRSVLWNWVTEASRFTPALHVLPFHGPRRKDDPRARQADVLVTSYAALRRDASYHGSRHYHYVILDEAQTIKDPDSQTARACRSLPASHRLALTGTPIENRLLDLWSLFAFLMPGLLGTREQFRKRFVVPMERQGDMRPRDRLVTRTSPFILRRLKGQVLPELPPLTETTRYCELAPDQAALYAVAASTFRERLKRRIADRGLQSSRFALLAALVKLRLVCCHPAISGLVKDRKVDSAKLDLFRAMTDQIVRSGHRVLVFSQFVRMLAVLAGDLEARRIPYAYLDGQTKHRQAVVNAFNRSDTPVFLMSLKAGGTGINLTGADYVIHYDPWWNPAVEAQATGRVHRIGQPRPVHAYRLVARGTVEEKILRLHEEKRRLANAVTPPSLPAALTEAEVDELLGPIEPEDRMRP